MGYPKKEIEVIKYDSVSLKFMVKDLSEDLGVLSTNNDELLLLIYPFQDSTTLMKPCLWKEFVADSLDFQFEFKFLPIKSEVEYFLVALIEIDTDKSAKEIDIIVRSKFSKLIRLTANKEYKEIEEILGDEDVLVMEKIENWRFVVPNSINYSGIHRMDSYGYDFHFFSGENTEYKVLTSKNH